MKDICISYTQNEFVCIKDNALNFFQNFKLQFHKVEGSKKIFTRMNRHALNIAQMTFPGWFCCTLLYCTQQLIYLWLTMLVLSLLWGLNFYCKADINLFPFDSSTDHSTISSWPPSRNHRTTKEHEQIADKCSSCKYLYFASIHLKSLSHRSPIASSLFHFSYSDLSTRPKIFSYFLHSLSNRSDFRTEGFIPF